MRAVAGAESRFKGVASTRLSRARPRAFPEWQALRRWGKLPPWEEDVAGYLLRALRAEAGLTQRELAARLGVSQQAVAQAERWSANPTASFMRGWAEACGASLRLSFAPRARREQRNGRTDRPRSTVPADP